MAKVRDQKESKKQMSEGTAIAVIVISIAAGGTIAYYLLKWIIGIFFPNLL